ncbi:DUF3488 and transglutaminase-like domain-containing protein [Streptomyces sp. HPF1205]|uniref:transglutaminase family protein n=1 Tax=Streptomyces sp. HPF1205 TaxID=2873262 RepID=UPI001CEC84B8|nr:DUF3488 and transglutaminase-like domain-containing protein [Streptomyces sp. HPF1205]
MSGRARLTVSAAAASLMAAAALLPLASPAGWYFQAVACVLLQCAVGAGARRIPLARPLTVLAQALVSLLALTVVFAPHQALGGIVPTPAAFRQLGQLVQSGLTDVGNYSIPAPVTPGIRLLLVGGVMVVALAVDATAVTYNSAAPAGLPLLALYSVAAGLHSGGTQWLYFLIAAGGYLLLLLAEGRDRLSRWGRVFGGPAQGGRPGGPGSLTTGGTASAPVRTGRRIGAMALGIALIAPLMLPSLGKGLLSTTGHGSGGVGGGNAGAVNLVAALQDNLNQPDDREVLTYRTTTKDVGGMYLRIAALDKFDGKQWSPSKQETEDLPTPFPRPQGMADDVPFTTVTTRVQVDDSYVQGLLPLPFPASSVSVPGTNWKFQPEGRMVVGANGQNASGVQYTVASMQVQPTAQELAGAPPATGRIASQYEKVPASLPAVVAATAQQVTRDATNDYERALDLQRYFTSGQFVYNTQAKAGTGVDAIARFLQTKEGFCVHFAFTMAAMARTLHIPARVAIGFTPGSQNPDGSMSVGLKDAHAWPELYFEGIGWTRFEPTPYRGSAPSYTQTPTTGTSNEPRDRTQHGGVTGPSATPSTSPSCAPDSPRQAADCGAAATAAGGGPGGGGIGAGRIALIALAAALMLLVPATPLLWRSRLRAARLGGGRFGSGRFAGGRLGGGRAVRAEEPALSAWREVLDTGWDYGVLPDDSETPRRAMARLVAEGRLSGEAAASASALATAVEQTLYAPHPRPVPGLAAEVQRVRGGLHASASRTARLRARLLPRSSVRLVWALSSRWTALSTRVSAAARKAASLPRPRRRNPKEA